MNEILQLRLCETYEELVDVLQSNFEKMAQFVVPVEDAEKKLAIIAQSMGRSGKIVLLLGLPGVGKSTFIKSLTWRKHLPIPKVVEINANEFFGPMNERLNLLYQELWNKAVEMEKVREPGSLLTIVINYLENLAEYPEENIRAFFRNINGLLRQKALLIIWPMTERDEAYRLLNFASAVSGTVFSEQPIVEFSGPPLNDFPVIIKNTISTLNPGLSFDDFLLTDDALNETLDVLRQQNKSQQTIRKYIKSVNAKWQNQSGILEEILKRIPKPTEVWFVVCYPDAENVVNQFARKSPLAPDDAWDADYRRLYEYIASNNQRAADWNATRLQLALRGAFRTKIMFMPTNAMVSCVASYGSQNSVSQELLQKILELLQEIEEITPLENWRKPIISRRFLESSPLLRQLRGESAKLGKRRSGSSAQSIRNASKIFEEINKYSQTQDRALNKCLAQALRECLKVDESGVIAENAHPFLDGIRPDILVLTHPNKIICIEMFYTVDTLPSTLADYVLTKMNRYMKQLEYISTQPRLFWGV